MKKITLLTCAVCLFTALHAQSYLGLDGGFEGSATIDNTTINTAPQPGTFTKANATQTIADETGTVRSGGHALNVDNTSTTGRRVWSPLITASGTSQLTFQYYIYTNSITNTQETQQGILTSSESLSGTYVAQPAGTWTKVTYTRASSSYTSLASVILSRRLNAGDVVYIDDLAVYQGAVDASAPLFSGTLTLTQPTETSTNLSWPTSGSSDVIGYLVVRYTTAPAANDDPNVNGIYAVGNTITVANTGTVVYNGTSTTFTDNTLPNTNGGTVYYYKVYAIDKAFNYSGELSANITLPIQLTAFHAELKRGGTLLSFTTASERNNAYFEVERSTDGQDYTSIGRVTGSISSNNDLSYTFTDENPEKGINYYRLKQVDLDGKFAYSPVRSVVLGKTGIVSLYPMPATETLHVQTETAFASDASWQILDITGRVLASGIFAGEQNLFELPVSQLTDGAYILRIMADQEVVTKQFRKQ